MSSAFDRVMAIRKFAIFFCIVCVCVCVCARVCVSRHYSIPNNMLC